MFPNPAPEGRRETFQLSYIPQMLAEYIQYTYMLYHCVGIQFIEIFSIRCQIVRGVKLSVFVGGVKLSWCQIVRGVRLSAVSKCPGCQIFRCQIIRQHGPCQIVCGVKLS